MENFKKQVLDIFKEFLDIYFEDRKHKHRFSIYSYKYNYTYFIYYDNRGTVMIDLNTVIFCLENSVSKETLMEWIDFIILYDDEYNHTLCDDFPYTRITLEEFINNDSKINIIKNKHQDNLNIKTDEQNIELENWLKDNNKNKSFLTKIKNIFNGRV